MKSGQIIRKTSWQRVSKCARESRPAAWPARASQIRSTFMWALAFQQVQKYEKGMNRVSSSRLVDLANALNVTIPYFFDEMSAGVGAQTRSALMKAGQRPSAIGNEIDPLAKRETLEL
jgi:transcriptional regulator with XRE-family HTH domain